MVAKVFPVYSWRIYKQPLARFLPISQNERDFREYPTLVFHFSSYQHNGLKIEEGGLPNPLLGRLQYDHFDLQNNRIHPFYRIDRRYILYYYLNFLKRQFRAYTSQRLGQVNGVFAKPDVFSVAVFLWRRRRKIVLGVKVGRNSNRGKDARLRCSGPGFPPPGHWQPFFRTLPTRRCRGCHP